mgnify:CR=1 FL=1
MTKAERAALKWLNEHGGDAVQQKRGVLAEGEFAPFNPSTWAALAKLGKVEFYTPPPYRRLRIVNEPPK